MGTGVGHGAAAEVLDKVVKLGAAEGVVGLDGVAADGLGDGEFAEAGEVDFADGGAELINEVEDEAAGVGNLDEGREGVEEEGALAEFAEADAEAGEGGELFVEELRAFFRLVR